MESPWGTAHSGQGAMCDWYLRVVLRALLMVLRVVKSRCGGNRDCNLEMLFMKL